MIRAFLKSLEDPNRPLLGPNFWLLNKIGLLLPKKFLPKIWKITIHEIATCFVCTQFVELYLIRSDFDRVLVNLEISMMTIINLMKIHSYVLWQDDWRQVIDYVTDADNFERNNQDEAKGHIIRSYTRYCRRVTYYYWVLMFTTFIIYVTTPFVKYLPHEFQERFHNGTESFPHIFSAWVPFDKENAPGRWITFLGQVVMCAYGTSLLAAFDTSVIVILVFFGGKLDLLRIRCSEMLGTNGVRISDIEADRVVRQLHEMHVLLLKHSRLFNSVLSPVMFLYVVVCSIVICVTAFQLNVATTITQKLFIAEYLVFVIIQLFMFCWHTNDVICKSEDVMLGPYESDWWAANLQQRSSVLILQGQMRIGHMYTAGPFTNLTLATCIAILKGAYSYYTLINQ